MKPLTSHQICRPLATYVTKSAPKLNGTVERYARVRWSPEGLRTAFATRSFLLSREQCPVDTV
jgi:hypothetical protein